jgi:hypothetical protein
MSPKSPLLFHVPGILTTVLWPMAHAKGTSLRAIVVMTCSPFWRQLFTFISLIYVTPWAGLLGPDATGTVMWCGRSTSHVDATARPEGTGEDDGSW